MGVLAIDGFSASRLIIEIILRQRGFSDIFEADDGATVWKALKRDKAIPAEAANYIEKPFTAETLGQKIVKIFASSSLFRKAS